MSKSTVSPGLWALAWRRLRRDRVAMVSLVIVCAYLLTVIAASLGWIAADWPREAGVNYAPPGFVGADKPATAAIADQAPTALATTEPGVVDPLAEVLSELRKGLAAAPAESARASTLPLGGDKWGRDVLKKAVKGTETSLVVGLVAALLAVVIATVMGAYAGYYGGRVDDFLNWVYSVFTAIPYLLLVLAIAAVLNQKGTLTVILILGVTGWTGIFRLVRAEYLKHRMREYVLAADAIGSSNARRMFTHIFPNVSHVVLVQLSLHVVLFIKMEVILSFLGFGVGVDTVSWGSMLNESQSELILGKWWQLTAATVAMAVLVTAFSLFTDALRDALDPRLK
jgi:ABC-type dipeptide/oligopeptide/nickel transport system permease subunit